MPEEPVVLALEARDRATAIFEKIDGALKKLGMSFGSVKKDAEGGAEQAATGFSKAIPALLGVGVAGASVAIGVGLISKKSIEAAADYQDAVSQMAATGGMSVAAAQKIGDAFLNTAGTTVFSAKQQIEALGPVSGQLELVLGHTVTVADATKVMAAAMNLAEASGIDLGAATKDVANVMQVYHLNTSQAAGATDILFDAARLTGQSVDAVATSVDRLAGRLGPLAPSLHDTATFMADLTAHGVQGRMAMMAATASMNTLLSGSKGSQEEIKKLGLSVFDANGKFVGMSSIIAQLQPKLAGMTEQQRLAAEKALFGATAGRELDAVILAGAKGYDALGAKIGVHNSAQDAAAKRAQDVNHQMAILSATMSDIWVIIGQQLIAVVQQLLGAMLPIITKVADWISHHRQLTTTILLVTGAVGALIAVAAVLAIVIGLIASPVTLVVLGIGLLTAAILYAWFHWKGFHDFIMWAWNNVLKPVATWLMHEAADSWSNLMTNLQTAHDLFDMFSKKVQEVWKDIKPIFDAIGGGLNAIGTFVAGHSSGQAAYSGKSHYAGRQSGGSVMAGMPYMVGEAGPELFVPSFSGSIVPGGGIPAAGQGGIDISMDFRGAMFTSERAYQDLRAILDKELVQRLGARGVNLRR